MVLLGWEELRLSDSLSVRPFYVHRESLYTHLGCCTGAIVVLVSTVYCSDAQQYNKKSVVAVGPVQQKIDKELIDAVNGK